MCGDAALYCDPYSVDDIADKMHKIIVDFQLSKVLIEKGYKHIEKYSWDRTAKSYLAYFESLIDCNIEYDQSSKH